VTTHPIAPSALFQSETRAHNTVRPETNSPAAQKLRKAASEFESLLLSNWWTTMKEGGLSGGEDGTDPGKDTLDHLGIQAMTTAVANGGGLGIGSMLVRSLLSTAEATKPAPASVPRAGNAAALPAGASDEQSRL
jgi:Rod binding domain-containing protein